MERGNRGSRRSRGRPFIRGYYRGRTRGRSILSSTTPDPREKFESYDDNEKSSTHEEKSWSSPSDKRHKTRENSRSPSKENNDNNNERNSPSEKKEYYSDAKYHKHSSDYPFRDQRRPYQNNYWERSTRGRPYSPQSQYRVRPYHSPTRNSRRYSRTPERRRSHSRYRSRSHTSSRYRSHSRSKSRSRRPSPSKHRSPRRRSISRHPKTSDEHNKFSDKNKIIRNTSDNSNDSDDFVEKLEASKNSKTPRRIEYSGNDNDEYWIESGKKNENIPKEPKTPGRSNFSSRAPKTPGRLELSAKDDDNYWEKSKSSKSAKKTQYLNTWDDSPIREEPFSKAPKTPGRKEFSSKDSDDYWTKSSPKIKELYSKKNKNQNLSSIYVQDLGSSNSECDNSPKQSRSMSITNSDKSDTPQPLSLTEKSSKSTNPSSISQTSISKMSKNISESLPPTIGSENLLGYGSHWTGMSNTSTSYLPTDNFSQPQVTQFTGYQHPIVPQNSQWYQPSYQQYGSQYQQFEQKQSIPFNQVHPNLEQVVSYQSSNQGLFNCDLKQVIDISKPPPNITSITPDVQSKNVQDNMFEMQRETYTTKLMSLKKELEFLQIQYDQFKSDNSNGHYNDELKQNRKAQDDINGKIKGVNNILEVLNTMIPKNSVNDIKKVETRKTIPESEYVSTKEDSIANFERSSILKSQSHSKSSSPSSEYKKRHSKPGSLKQEKKTLRSQLSDEDDCNLKKSRQSKETLESKKKKNRNIAKVPQFNFVYCDSCIHWCQTCNIFPKTAKEYLTHLQSESHKTILEELNIVELPWHNTQVEPTQPEKNPELPNKRVPIKGLEFFIGTTAWYCKLCDTWIGDLHCASAHFKSKSHNDLYAALIAKEPNWEIDWLTKRTRAFEKSLLQVNKSKQEFIKEEKLKDSIVIESKPEKSFFEKDFKKEKERDKEKERLRDKNKREIVRKNTEIKNKLSPIIGENNDSNNVSISDWMKPINLPVEKSLITLKENVQKAKEKLGKHKTDEVEEYKSRTSETQKNKKQKLDEPKAIDSTEKKEDNCIMINRSKIKLPFIGKMPFAKPVTKKTAGSQSKEVPNYMVETKCEELKEKPVTSVESQMHIMEHMISAINEKKIEKQTLPIDMDIDDENEYDEMILGAKTNLFQPQLNIDLPRNQVLHNFNLPHTSSLPQDLNAALNMIFPCNEPSIGTCVSVPVNIQNNNLMDPQNICIYPEMNRMLNSSPERKKKKNAPSQRKRRHMKKNMGKDDEYNKNEEEEVDDKLDELISSVSRKDNINKSNGNESEGDELAMLGIDVEDMAAQYY